MPNLYCEWQMSVRFDKFDISLLKCSKKTINNFFLLTKLFQFCIQKTIDDTFLLDKIAYKCFDI